MDWFRMKSGFRHNAKVQLLSDKLFRCYVNLLCLANEGNPRGVLPTVEEVAYDLRLTLEEASLVLDELTQRGLIDRVRGGKMMPHNWSQHQRVWDDGADKQRQYRSRKTASGAALKVMVDTEPLRNELHNGDVTSYVQNRTEQNRAEQSRTESESEMPKPEQPTFLDNQEVVESERVILHELNAVKGYPFDYAKDLEHIRKLAVQFPLVDLLSVVRKWATAKLDKPLKAKSNPRLEYRNWCEHEQKWAAERQARAAPASPPRNPFADIRDESAATLAAMTELRKGDAN